MPLLKAGKVTRLDDLSDRDLTTLAATAFQQGLKDGRVLSMPRNAGQVMLLLPPYERRIIHKRKLRQVYVAGYDITRALRLLDAEIAERQPGLGMVMEDC